MAPALAALNPPQFLVWLGMRWDVVRVNRLAIHLLAEAEQQLRQITCRVQTVRPWSVVPLLVAIKLYLQAQVLDVQIVALAHQRRNHGLQSFLIIGKLGGAAGTSKLCHKLMRITYTAILSLLLALVRS